jgi:hypothetical protein
LTEVSWSRKSRDKSCENDSPFGEKGPDWRLQSDHLKPLQVWSDSFFSFQSSKPIMEKRRRARINASLSELKSLLLEVMKKEAGMVSIDYLLVNHATAKDSFQQLSNRKTASKRRN